MRVALSFSDEPCQERGSLGRGKSWKREGLRYVGDSLSVALLGGRTCPPCRGWWRCLPQGGDIMGVPLTSLSLEAPGVVLIVSPVFVLRPDPLTLLPGGRGQLPPPWRMWGYGISVKTADRPQRQPGDSTAFRAWSKPQSQGSRSHQSLVPIPGVSRVSQDPPFAVWSQSSPR